MAIIYNYADKVLNSKSSENTNRNTLLPAFRLIHSSDHPDDQRAAERREHLQLRGGAETREVVHQPPLAESRAEEGHRQSRVQGAIQPDRAAQAQILTAQLHLLQAVQVHPAPSHEKYCTPSPPPH